MASAYPIAIVREVSASIAQCQLTHLQRQPIDVERARAQHAQYANLLGRLGYRLVWLPTEEALPDAVFVEDTAVVLDEIAVIGRLGAAPRLPEIETAEAALRACRPLARIEAPGCLEGGDVLRIGKRIYVGRSGRTNREGIEQLRAIAAPYGYAILPIEVRGCLHLKSAITQVGAETLLINPRWVDPAAFAGYRLIEADPDEAFGANALLTQAGVIYPAAYPRTLERLSRQGIDAHTVEVSELAKAEGAVTCCSLIIDAPA